MNLIILFFDFFHSAGQVCARWHTENSTTTNHLIIIMRIIIQEVVTIMMIYFTIWHGYAICSYIKWWICRFTTDSAFQVVCYIPSHHFKQSFINIPLKLLERRSLLPPLTHRRRRESTTWLEQRLEAFRSNYKDKHVWSLNWAEDFILGLIRFGTNTRYTQCSFSAVVIQQIHNKQRNKVSSRIDKLSRN